MQLNHPSVERRFHRRRWSDRPHPVALESDPKVVAGLAVLAVVFIVGLVVGLIVGRFL